MAIIAVQQSRGSIISDLYGFAQVSAWNNYRLFSPSYPETNEPDIWEVMLRDPVIMAGRNQRNSSIVSGEWTCQPGGDDPKDKIVAGVMRSLLSRIDNFTMARRELADGSILGRSYQYVEGERQWMRAGKTLVRLPWWVPTKLRDVDRRRIHFRPQIVRDEKMRPKGLTVTMMIFSITSSRWLPITNPEWFVKLVYNDEECRNGYGRGLMEAIYFYHYVKGVVLEEGLEGLKRWARGLPVVGVDGLRSAGVAEPNDVVVDKWLEWIRKMQAETGLVFDKSDTFDVKWPSGEGHRQVFDFLEYCDSCITRLLTGSVRPSGGAVRATGHGGQAETEAETSETIFDYEREVVDEAITRDLIGLVWRQNATNLALLGLSDAAKPKFETTQKPNESFAVNADILVKARRELKLPVLEEEAYQKLGLTRPAEGDQVLDPLEDAQQSLFPSNAFGGSGQAPKDQDKSGDEKDANADTKAKAEAENASAISGDGK